MRRYPFAAIAPLLADLTAAEVASLAGVTTRTVVRWRHDGGTIAELDADQLATALHVHPTEVWADWYADVMKPCAECSTPFVPRSRTHKYCERICERRARDRRYKRTERGAELNRERRRRYYAENADYERARYRRFYAENAESERARKRVEKKAA